MEGQFFTLEKPYLFLTKGHSPALILVMLQINGIDLVGYWRNSLHNKCANLPQIISYRIDTPVEDFQSSGKNLILHTWGGYPNFGKDRSNRSVQGPREEPKSSYH